MKNKMIAMDAGSTNCTLKIVYEDGASEFIENELGKKITPVNILIGKKDGEEHTLIGEHAKDQSVIFPDRHFTNWKREMGSKKTIRIVDGKEYTPEILSGIMFKQKKKEAEEYCGSEIKEILITVPVTYNAMQKEAVKDAGVLAGFERDNIHIRLESDAAVKSADAHNDFRGSVCCLDCGGSTTDATVCNVTESEIRVQFTKGDQNFAGKEFDNCMVNLVKNIITENIKALKASDSQKKELIHSLNSLTPYAAQELKLNAEKAKEDLTKLQKTAFPFCFAKGEKGTTNVQVTKEQYEKACEEELLPHFRQFLKELKDEAKENGMEINYMVLTGGSSNMPCIQKEVEKAFPDSDIRVKNPEFSICEGAALMALELIGADNSGRNQSDTEQDRAESGSGKKFISACNAAYGVRAYVDCEDESGNIVERKKVCNLLYRNSPLPASFERQFWTHEDGQKCVVVSVYESNLMNESVLELSQCTCIAQATLEFKDKLPKGSEITIKMCLDEDYVLHTEAFEKTGGTSIETSVTVTNGMNNEELDNGKKVVEDIFDRNAG